MDALASKHEVLRASRSSELKVNVEYLVVEAMFAKAGPVDAIVSCAGGTPERFYSLFGPLDSLDDAKLTTLFDLMRVQLKFILTARKFVRSSIVVTTGALAQQPMPGSVAITMMASGLEGFVKGAVLDMPTGTRINAVSPGWVKETMEKLKMDSTTGMPAKVLAASYVTAVEGTMTGQIIQPWRT